MLILNPDADEERESALLERTRGILSSGSVDHVNDWGRKKLGYEVGGSTSGRIVVMTVDAEPSAIDELRRVTAINKDLVLRSQVIRLTAVEAAHAKENGAPAPVEEKIEADSRGGRGSRGPRRRPR